MVAPKPVPPGTFKQILEKCGFEVVEEDVFNWLMAANDHDIPFTVPKLGDLVHMDVMMNILDKAKIDNGRYFGMLAEITGAENPTTVN